LTGAWSISTGSTLKWANHATVLERLRASNEAVMKHSLQIRESRCGFVGNCAATMALRVLDWSSCWTVLDGSMVYFNQFNLGRANHATAAPLVVERLQANDEAFLTNS
jgi:hypothetical protein